ncbi:ABC transporter substrate-binding protein, partial [Rhizobium ruizarguesonis]
VAATAPPPAARAESGSMADAATPAATFPGSWEDAYRTVLTPMVKDAGYDLTIAPAMAQDQLAKIMASPGNPPYDTMLMSPGQMAVAIEKDLIQKIDQSKLKNWG